MVLYVYSILEISNREYNNIQKLVTTINCHTGWSLGTSVTVQLRYSAIYYQLLMVYAAKDRRREHFANTQNTITVERFSAITLNGRDYVVTAGHLNFILV